MEPIINSQVPEFKVQAFHNGEFKTVTNKDIFSSYCLLSFVYIRSEAFRVVIALSDQLILLHVRGIESSIFIDCFLFKAVQKYIKPLKDRQKSGGFYIFFKNITGKQSVPEQ